jgi:PKD domain
MSSTFTTIGFSAIDYTGLNTLSSYALPLTPLTFVPDLNELALVADNSHRIVWDFGDGTLSKSFSASKYYQFPGIYDVNMIVYDCDNNAQISTKVKTLQIYDYVPFTFNIVKDRYLLTEDGNYIVSQDGKRIEVGNKVIFLKCGEISNALTFSASYPPYQPTSNIFYSVSGSECENYWDIKNNKFSHLENFYAIYEQVYNYHLKTPQYVEVDQISLVSSNVYAKISNNTLLMCEENDVGASLVGKKALKNIYIKSDKITTDVYWKFNFDKTNNILPYYKSNTDHLNNLGITLKLNVIDNPPTKLSITSNGLDGESYAIDSFDINPIKYYNTKIPFVIKLKNTYNSSIKNFESIQLSSLNFELKYDKLSGASFFSYNGSLVLYNGSPIQYSHPAGSVTLSQNAYKIYSLNETLSSQNSGGCFRGYITFPNLSSKDILKNITIKASGTFVSDQLLSYPLIGSSSKFTVYPDNYFDAYKKNENFNAEQTLMDLRFQETLFDKDVLFKDFLGGVLGNENSDHNGVGLKIYEKISNFVSNTQDIDNCEIDNIKSSGLLMSYNNHNEENYKYPDKIKRILNLASISKTNLLGTSNKFRENFDVKGRTSKTEYGINIGNQIDTLTYQVSAGTPIIALEKFSNTYTLLDTHQPVFHVYSDYYPLSTYDSSFGWPLVLPNDFNVKDFEKYYLFFEYSNKIEGSPIGGLLDFQNEKTTIKSNVTQDNLFKDNEIIDNMFNQALYKSLELIN